MARYFLELAYLGTHYSGFQVQQNANTVQAEVEKALNMLMRTSKDSAVANKYISLTGSSRTDAGVHALQNFFHFDWEEKVHPQIVYKLNAVLPSDIVVKGIIPVLPAIHCRFDALGRTYEYRIHQVKNPFIQNTSCYYPYKLDVDKMNEAAGLLLFHSNYFGFSKSNTQVKNFDCRVRKAHWFLQGENLWFEIEANRFLRGMVRLLVGSMLRVGRKQIEIQAFSEHFESGKKSGYAAPAQGLFLKQVLFPAGVYIDA